MFVFGGYGDELLDSIEYSSLLDEQDSQERPRLSQWTWLRLEDLSARSNPLLAMIKENIMLIYGGYDDSRLRSDGFLFDTESKQVVRRIDALNFRFDCARNRHCIT